MRDREIEKKTSEKLRKRQNSESKFFIREKNAFLKKIMDDLTTFELEQIARLEAKCVEARHKSSQERSILAKIKCEF